jgi:hypothetical protein
MNRISRRIFLQMLIHRSWCDFNEFQIQWISTRSNMRELDFFRSRILFHISLQIFQRENVETSFVMFDQLRLKDFAFINSMIEFLDHVFMSSLIMKRVIFIRDFVSSDEVDIMRYRMKFKKVKMILFNFVFYRTRRTKDFLIRVESKKSLIKIFQCRIVMKFILSYENEVYHNLSKIHRMRSFFDHQRSDDRNDLTNDDFCFFFVHCLISENFWKIFRSMKEKIFRNRAFNLSKSDKSVTRIVCSLRFRLIDIFFFRRDWIQIRRCIIIFLNNWCKMSIIMISWMLTKE